MTNLLGESMKHLVTALLVACLTGCGTIGGMVSGAGSDLSKAGEWIKSK